MGSTEEQLGYLAVIDIDVSSYMNILLSFGFVVFLFAFCLIYLWETLTGYPNPSLQNNEGYTEVDSENTILDTSSAFLEDDEDALELKQTNRNNTQ